MAGSAPQPVNSTLAAMSTLAQLQTWYSHQCNGEWEHSSGVIIQSCDNPGWWVKINLIGTPLQTQPFTEIAEGVMPGGSHLVHTG
jgi:hypothetical protein